MITEDKNDLLSMLPYLEATLPVADKIKAAHEDSFPQWGQPPSVFLDDLQEVRGLHHNIQQAIWTIKRLTNYENRATIGH